MVRPELMVGFAGARGPLYRSAHVEAPSSGKAALSGGIGADMIEPWRELYHYWRSKHVDARPPSRDELDPPLEIPRIAQNLLLVDIHPHGLEYRLAGTNFVKGAGLDVTGMMVGSSGRFAHVIEIWKSALAAAHETSEPRLLAGKFAPHVAAGLTLLLLPLTASADGVPKILGGLFVEGEFPPSTQIEGLEPVEITG